MTGTELLTAACHLFFETDTAYYEPFALSHINTLLADTYEVNNRLRAINAKTEFPTIPSLAALGGTIPYEDLLVRTAFPYGLASKLYFDDNDPTRMSLLAQQYVGAVNAADRGFVSCVGGIDFE